MNSAVAWGAPIGAITSRLFRLSCFWSLKSPTEPSCIWKIFSSWGVKMVDKDEELYGRRLSAKAFIVLSDGQSWSGEVERALTLAQERNIHV